MKIANFEMQNIFYTYLLILMNWGRSRVLCTEYSAKITNKRNASFLTIWYFRCIAAYVKMLGENKDKKNGGIE